MRLEVGKQYRTRDGHKVECLVADERLLVSQKARCLTHDGSLLSYHIDGRFNITNSESCMDIVSEWQDPVERRCRVGLYQSFDGGYFTSLSSSLEDHELVGASTVVVRKGEFS